MVKKARPKANNMIDRFVFRQTYKRFKKNPLVVFVARDFGSSNPNKFREKYLNTLKYCGLIEEVPTVYQCGTKLKVRRTVKGYKLKKRTLPIILLDTDDPKKIKEFKRKWEKSQKKK